MVPAFAEKKKCFVVRLGSKEMCDQAPNLSLYLGLRVKYKGWEAEADWLALNQPWIFTKRTDAEAEASIFWPPDAKSQLKWKTP